MSLDKDLDYTFHLSDEFRKLFIEEHNSHCPEENKVTIEDFEGYEIMISNYKIKNEILDEEAKLSNLKEEVSKYSDLLAYGKALAVIKNFERRNK